MIHAQKSSQLEFRNMEISVIILIKGRQMHKYDSYHKNPKSHKKKKKKSMKGNKNVAMKV